MVFQSTLPLRGATRLYMFLSDDLCNFNPRSPCGERPFSPLSAASCSVVFQSTLPLRGATVRDLHGHSGRRISIHAPLAGSDPHQCPRPTQGQDFNPRSPCGERLSVLVRAAQKSPFQSTLPLRGATVPARGPGAGDPISIHAPLAGSDDKHSLLFWIPFYFNPRSPCGERLSRQSI